MFAVIHSQYKPKQVTTKPLNDIFNDTFVQYLLETGRLQGTSLHLTRHAHYLFERSCRRPILFPRV